MGGHLMRKTGGCGWPQFSFVSVSRQLKFILAYLTQLLTKLRQGNEYDMFPT